MIEESKDNQPKPLRVLTGHDLLPRLLALLKEDHEGLELYDPEEMEYTQITKTEAIKRLEEGEE